MIFKRLFFFIFICMHPLYIIEYLSNISILSLHTIQQLTHYNNKKVNIMVNSKWENHYFPSKQCQNNMFSSLKSENEKFLRSI